MHILMLCFTDTITIITKATSVKISVFVMQDVDDM